MAGRFVVDIEDAARRDRLFCALTMFAVCDRRPDWNGGHTVAPRGRIRRPRWSVVVLDRGPARRRRPMTCDWLLRRVR